MIDKKTIQEKYSSMQDSELKVFAETEYSYLTPEAMAILQEELKKREIIILTDEIEREVIENPMLILAMDLLEYHSNTDHIMNELMERGLDEQSAEALFSTVYPIALKKQKKAENQQLLGTLMFFAGVAITFLPIDMARNRLTFIIAWCSIIFGVLRFIQGRYNRNRFNKILKNIKV